MRSVTFRHTLDRLRVNLWFLPLVSAIIAIILAWVLVWVDGFIPNETLEDSRFILAGNVSEVHSGTLMALVWPAAQVDQALAEQIRRTFELGHQRTPTQDVEYAINQLVQVAVRAMSPAINDPFMAMTCLDYLSDGLALIAGYGERPAQIYFYDHNDRLRLVFESVTFAELLAAAFDMLRHASGDNASILLHLLNTLEVIGRASQWPEARQELLRHVALVEAESQNSALIEPDKQAIRRRAEALRDQFADGPRPDRF